jgi:uridine kinase
MRIQSYQDLAVRVLATPARLGTTRLVAIDGRAGSGKTSFAARLHTALLNTGTDAALLHTDDLLNGWSHPTGFTDRLHEWVLNPLEKGEEAGYHAYDWHAQRFNPQRTLLGRPQVLIIEGVTSASAQRRPQLSYGVFVHADPQLCLDRGLRRDGDQLRPQWTTWQQQEVVHFADDPTRPDVDLVVSGAPSIAVDMDREFLIED